jgi:NAD(P)-dependent dehydrogenase (short-subunit alcohol dehydrogenase family)
MAALQGVWSVISSKLFVTLAIPQVKDYPDLPSQTIIVTGANTGLGYEASVHLCRLGLGKLIMGVRTPSKGEVAKKRTLALFPKRNPDSIEVWQIDMNDYASVKAFAARASASLPRLDGVLANAGIMTSEFTLSEGLESNLNVNVISTFLLYLLLLPKMRESGRKTGNPCRFSVPNSALHYTAPLAELDPSSGSIIDRLDDPKKADMQGRYALTKLLVVYLVRAFAERDPSPNVILNTPNPSFCKSGLAREMQGNRGFDIFEGMLARSTEEGSRALVHGVLAGNETNGEYISNCRADYRSVRGPGEEKQHET